MNDNSELIKVARDLRKNKLEQFSVNQGNDLLHEALVQYNGGKTTLDRHDIQNGNCREVFALIEEIIPVVVWDDLTGTEFWNQFVDSRNIALGDKNIFQVEDRTMLSVAKAAEGHTGIRRQRLSGVNQLAIQTDLYVCKVYEELIRVLAGRVDFNVLTNKVTDAFEKAMRDQVFALWYGVTADDIGGDTFFRNTGSYDRDELRDLVDHVEAAANGQTPTIIGTRKALRNVIEDADVLSEVAKTEMHNNGFVGYWYGVPVMCIPQRHQYNNYNFLLNDDVLTVAATDQKPIKVVTEGDSFIWDKDPTTNADLTYELLCGMRWGMRFVMAGVNNGLGIYTLA